MKDEFVMVPRELVARIARAGCWPNDADELRAVLAKEHRGEPVALPERKDYTQYWVEPGAVHKAEGWNACLDEIAKLGPLYTRPVQGEPVAYLCKSESAKWLQYGSKVGDPWKPGEVEVIPLFGHADPGEVERLRTELENSYTVAEHERLVAKGQETNAAYIKSLLAQLAKRNALLDRVVDHANFWHDHPYAEVVEAIAKDYKVLSASAELEVKS